MNEKYSSLVKQINEFVAQSSEYVCELVLENGSRLNLMSFSVEEPDVFVFDCENDKGVSIKVIRSTNQLNVMLAKVPKQTNKTKSTLAYNKKSRTVDVLNA